MIVVPWAGLLISGMPEIKRTIVTRLGIIERTVLNLLSGKQEKYYCTIMYFYRKYRKRWCKKDG